MFRKLCLSCLKPISIFAGRCPYCLDENQRVDGRIIGLLLLFALLFGAGYIYLRICDSPSPPPSIQPATENVVYSREELKRLVAPKVRPRKKTREQMLQELRDLLKE